MSAAPAKPATGRSSGAKSASDGAGPKKARPMKKRRPLRKATAASRSRLASPAVRSQHDPARLAQVLVEPIVSEKATMAAEKHNQVLFKVLRDATKIEIKAAVEAMFKVEVESVSTVVQKGKTKRFAKTIGRRDHIKKAYVSLKEGQELNFSGEAA